MPCERLPHPLDCGTAAILLLWTIALVGCARYSPEPMASVPFLERAVAQERDGSRVTVAVPGDEESERLFGVPLASQGIQPVWLRIENSTERPYWFAPLGLDPGYFTPLEAASRARYLFSSRANEEVQEHLLSSAIRPT